MSTKLIALVLFIGLMGKYLFGCQHGSNMAVIPTKALQTSAPKVEYFDSIYPEYVELYKQVPMQEMIDVIWSVYRVPEPIRVAVGDCGTANAFYIPSDRLVAMCAELPMAIELLMEMPRDQIKEVLLFVVAHELSHALIDVMDLPAPGGQEDMADSLAAFLMAHTDSAWVDRLVTAANWLELIDTDTNGPHSRGMVRANNIRCYVAGLDESAGREARVQLPVERAGWCKREYRDKTNAWIKATAPYILDK